MVILKYKSDHIIHPVKTIQCLLDKLQTLIEALKSFSDLVPECFLNLILCHSSNFNGPFTVPGSLEIPDYALVSV